MHSWNAPNVLSHTRSIYFQYGVLNTLSILPIHSQFESRNSWSAALRTLKMQWSLRKCSENATKCFQSLLLISLLDTFCFGFKPKVFEPKVFSSRKLFDSGELEKSWRWLRFRIWMAKQLNWFQNRSVIGVCERTDWANGFLKWIFSKD